MGGGNTVEQKKYKKKQIILLNTGLPIADFSTKISTRYNGKYTKTPTYSIAKDGTTFQYHNPTFLSEVFYNNDINKQAISIALENIGWVTYNNHFEKFQDWRGVEYFGKPLNTDWRGKKHWDLYTDAQFLALIKLIDYLCLEYSIEKYFIGNNVAIENPLKFKGILNRSNYFKNYYDLTPAFNFEKLINEIN